MNTKISDSSALVLLWARDAYTTPPARRYMELLDMSSGEDLYQRCSVIFKDYDKVIEFRKWTVKKLVERAVSDNDRVQVIILGSGLAPLGLELQATYRDTGKSLKIFEVDIENLPFKQELTAKVDLDANEQIAYITMDVTSPNLFTELERRGWHPNEGATLVIMEGLSYYLDKDSLKQIVLGLGKLSPKAFVLMDYLLFDEEIQADFRAIPEDVFGIIAEYSSISCIRRYNLAELQGLADWESCEHYNLHRIERAVTGANRIFKRPDWGWIELVLFRYR